MLLEELTCELNHGTTFVRSGIKLKFEKKNLEYKFKFFNWSKLNFISN
jgi:hypothetical protein